MHSPALGTRDLVQGTHKLLGLVCKCWLVLPKESSVICREWWDRTPRDASTMRWNDQSREGHRWSCNLPASTLVPPALKRGG